MSTINKIADGVIWTIASKFLSAAYAFVAVPILIGLYGKADYGLIGLALSINIYMTLLDLGFSNTNLECQETVWDQYYLLWINRYYQCADHLWHLFLRR